jgi:hypothetical protein
MERVVATGSDFAFTQEYLSIGKSSGLGTVNLSKRRASYLRCALERGLRVTNRDYNACLPDVASIPIFPIAATFVDKLWKTRRAIVSVIVTCILIQCGREPEMGMEIDEATDLVIGGVLRRVGLTRPSTRPKSWQVRLLSTDFLPFG